LSISRRVTEYAASRLSGTIPQISTVTNHSGWPATNVEPSATRASHGVLTGPGAPGMASQAALQASPNEDAEGSSAGPTSGPVPNRLRLATTLAATVAAAAGTAGTCHALLGFFFR